ncbi:MAG: transglutaminase domain-containing protein [Lachnospiraceae bacterium]|nr:transglutaminase domain-containing protein [Lachnospiraceae bacterium]
MKRFSFFAVMAIALVGVIMLSFYRNQCVQDVVYAEAGSPVEASAFAAKPDVDVRFTDMDGAVLLDVGEHTVRVKTDLFQYDCRLIVEDTTAPEGNVSDCVSRYGEPVEPEAFFDEVKDATAVECSFAKKPDWNKTGRQKVELKLTDAAGNVSEYETELLVYGAVESLERELGNVKVSPMDYAMNDEVKLYWGKVPDWDTFDSVGTYQLEILEGTERYEVDLVVKDTIAPKLVLKDVSSWIGKKLIPEDYVEAAEDESPVQLSFVSAPDYRKEGEQEVEIVAEDASGNRSTGKCKLVLEKDTIAPVISGVEQRTVYIGDSVAYKKGITVTDNVDEKPKLEIDTSAVDLKKVGWYEVIYTATDSVGNTVSETMKLRVEEQKYSEASISVMAAEVLAKIFTEGMTDREKLTAIYNWIHKNIRYYDYSDKNSWTKSAYQGFADHRGDCYTYAATAQALLIEAGIKNMMINRIPDTYRHYWNLVDIGEGWYHYDTCPRLVKHNFDYIGDDELMEYSKKNKYCHHYDRSLFPEIQKK